MIFLEKSETVWTEVLVTMMMPSFATSTPMAYPPFPLIWLHWISLKRNHVFQEYISRL